MLTIESRLILVFLTSLFITLLVLPKLSSIALRLGLMDEPNHRKVHTQPRPLVGGIGMVLAATLALLLFTPADGIQGLFLGLAVLLCIGFLDDYVEVGPKRKFLAQIIAACFMIYCNKALLLSLGNLLGTGELLLPGGVLVAWLVTVFCTVGVINSVNLIDGLDGLAGGISFIAFFYFGAHACLAGNYNLLLLNLAFAGGILGFLHYNWNPAKLFMGDAGSLCLGFALAFTALVSSQGAHPVLPPVSALLILAVPITDTVVVMGKRMMKGNNPFVADKYHLHHIFLRYGLDRESAVRLILLISGGLGGLTLLGPLYSVTESKLFLIYLVYFVGYFISSFYITDLMRITNRHRRRNAELLPKSRLTRFFFGTFDMLQVYRKSPRYSVNLDCQVELIGKGHVQRGKIVNLSRTGCLIKVKSECELADKSNIIMDLPLRGRLLRLEVGIERQWTCRVGRTFYYGVNFAGMAEENAVLLTEYIGQLRRGRVERIRGESWVRQIGDRS